MTSLVAPAKINLALVVGPRRDDGKHELVTVYERIAAGGHAVARACRRAGDRGLPGRHARHARADGPRRCGGRRARVEGHDREADPCRRRPRRRQLGRRGCAHARQRDASDSRSRAAALHDLAAALGADVPLFLTSGPQLGEGDGTQLTPLALPRDYCVLVAAAGRRAEALDEGRVRRVRRPQR